MKDIVKGVVYLGIFAIPFIPLIIANSMFFPYITGKNFTFRIIVEIVAAAWLILALYEPKYRPKFSWLLVGWGALLAIMAVANALGQDPNMSFWSNFERMEGYVTLVHTFLYFIVAGSVLTTDKLWDRWFNTTLIAATLLAMYAFAQLSGNITINQGGWRLDGTLGNSAYMAIYTLFHVFIAIWLFVRTPSRGWRIAYGAFIALFVYLLIQTATRGTILGLVGGLTIMTAYIALLTKEHPRVRKAAGAVLLTLVVIVGLFIAFRESTFIQNNPYLARVANITLSEGNIRFKIWNMAYEGFQERPLLGWGQSNFNYVFNAKYDPSLYAAEAWYDRVHNIVFDWLIAGGILGFLAYFFIYGSALYYLIIKPWRTGQSPLTVAERGVLIGLLAGYMFHNLFVFDNIVSYIYYGTILALIHSRVARPFATLDAKKYDAAVVEQVAAPVIAVALIAVVYFVNVPGIIAAKDIINAFRATAPEESLAHFERALSRDSFADQEIREQMTRQAQNVIGSAEASEELKQTFFKRTEEELLKQIEEKPGDARVHVFLSSYYRMTKNTDPALKQLVTARELSPKKQQIIFEQGLASMLKEDYAGALAFFKEAFELDQTYMEARLYYAAAAVYADQPELLDEILTNEAERNAFAMNDLAVQAVYTKRDYERLKTMFEYRVTQRPDNTQERISLAFVLNELGDTSGALSVLGKAGEEIPDFKSESERLIAQLLQQNAAAGKVVLPEAQ